MPRSVRNTALSTMKPRSEEHTSELRHPSISYAVFCLKKKKEEFCEVLCKINKFGSIDMPILVTSLISGVPVVSLTLQVRRRSKLILAVFFFFNDTATTEIYTLSLHDALPISSRALQPRRRPAGDRGGWRARG